MGTGILSGVKQDKGEGGSFEPVSGLPPRLGAGTCAEGLKMPDGEMQPHFREGGSGGFKVVAFHRPPIVQQRPPAL